MSIVFDTTISLGHVIEAATFIIGGVVFMVSMKSDVKNVKSELEDLKVTTTSNTNALSKITDVLVVLGRQDERLAAHGKRLDGLEAHQKGY